MNSIYFIYSILVLMTGMSIGSFMNVVIYRLPQMIYEQEPGFSLAWPPSHCPSCSGKIHWYDNIPLFSWLLLGGKCRHCKSPIGMIYPVTELLIGLCFVSQFIIVTRHGDPDILVNLQLVYRMLPGLTLFCLLYCIFMIDFRHYLIPDVLSYAVLWSGLLFSVLHLNPVSAEMAITGCVVMWLIMKPLQLLYHYIRNINGLGDGDIKLFVALMAWFGLTKIAWLVMLSALLGLGIFAIIYLVRRITGKGSHCDVLAGDGDDAAADDTDYLADIDQNRHMPFGPAIALAALMLFIYL